MRGLTGVITRNIKSGLYRATCPVAYHRMAKFHTVEIALISITASPE